MSLKQEPELGKNFWLAMLLSMLVLMGYPYFMSKFVPQNTAAENQHEVQGPSTETAPRDPALTQAAPQLPRGTTELSPAQVVLSQTPEYFDYESGQYKLRFSNLGASLVYLEQTSKAGHEAHGTVFYSRESSANALVSPGTFALRLAHESADLSYTFFKLKPHQPGSDRVEYEYEKPGEYRITKSFVMGRSLATIGLEIRLENLSAHDRHFPIELSYSLDYDPAAKVDFHFNEAIVMGEKIETAKADKVEKKGFFSNKPILWAGLAKKYYMIGVKPEWKIVAAETRGTSGVPTMNSMLRMEPVTLTPGETQTRKVLIYAGPQQYEHLKKTGAGFDAYFSRGMLGLFKVWLLVSLTYLNGFLHNYGWSIIALTVLIKVLFAPITHISFASQRKMQAIQPKMAALKERYKDNAEKLHKETMELFKRNRVNPMAGCLPMLVQMPVLIAMYHLLSEAVELQGAPFIGWMVDLSQPDRLFMFPFTVPFLGWDAFNLLPIFMIASQYGFQKIMPQPSTSPEQAMIFNLMPVMFGFISYNMPAGLVLYWSLQNLLSIAHHMLVSRSPVNLHHEDKD